MQENKEVETGNNNKKKKDKVKIALLALLFLMISGMAAFFLFFGKAEMPVPPPVDNPAKPTATAKPTAKPTETAKPTVKPTVKPTETVKPKAEPDFNITIDGKKYTTYKALKKAVETKGFKKPVVQCNWGNFDFYTTVSKAKSSKQYKDMYDVTCFTFMKDLKEYKDTFYGGGSSSKIISLFEFHDYVYIYDSYKENRFYNLGEKRYDEWKVEEKTNPELSKTNATDGVKFQKSNGNVFIKGISYTGEIEKEYRIKSKEDEAEFRKGWKHAQEITKGVTLK